MSKKTRNIWEKLSRLAIFGTYFAEKLSRIKIRIEIRECLQVQKRKKIPNVIVVDEDLSKNKSLLLKTSPFLWLFFDFMSFEKTFAFRVLKNIQKYRVENGDLEFPNRISKTRKTRKLMPAKVSTLRIHDWEFCVTQARRMYGNTEENVLYYTRKYHNDFILL